MIISNENLSEFKDLSLSNFISSRAFHKDRGHIDITCQHLPDRDQLFSLLSKRARVKNRALLERSINWFPYDLKNYGIFDRVHYDVERGWSYCAGQDYPSEIATVRNLLIEAF
jgi:hypothetical protein